LDHRLAARPIDAEGHWPLPGLKTDIPVICKQRLEIVQFRRAIIIEIKYAWQPPIGNQAIDVFHVNCLVEVAVAGASRFGC
jgi:hypothetical protein